MQIQYGLLDLIKTNLITVCQDQVDSGDPTRPDLVKIGRMQISPTEASRYVSISCGDQQDPELKDGIITLDSMDNVGLSLPPREIFGGEYWWRRGSIELGCFFVYSNYDEETSHNYAYDFLGRVDACMRSLNVANLTDSYKENAIRMYTFASTMAISGGPPTSYIARGSLKWQCLTYRS